MSRSDESAAHSLLAGLAARPGVHALQRRFAEDAARVERFSWEAPGVHADASKQPWDAEIFDGLVRYARAQGMEQGIAALFAGERVNTTEERAALHVALRAPAQATFAADGEPVMGPIVQQRARVRDFVSEVHTGRRRGHTGAPFTAVVHLGIGGSELGPHLVCAALRGQHRSGLDVRFVSNLGAGALDEALEGLRPEQTLFIVASKTFTTAETLQLAGTARQWLAQGVGSEGSAAHFAAVTAAPEKAAAFGIAPDACFELWDWVGGRYSLWSTVGALPSSLALGSSAVEALRRGAAAMDEHFRTRPLERNLPVVLALLRLWQGRYLGQRVQVVVPYDHRLRLLPAHLQQVDMESLGKRVRRDGSEAAGPTGPALLGQPGTTAQHAFFQALHQGTDVLPVEFIAVAEGPAAYRAHHEVLLANCLAQSMALMCGKSAAAAEAELLAAGVAPDRAARLAAHRSFPGERPSTTLALRSLEAESLGALLALYEHRVYAESLLYGINAFDQYGVELGKQLASSLVGAVRGEAPPPEADPSTRGLLRWLTQARSTEPR